MSERIHIAAVQYDVAWEDKPANHATVERMLVDADLPSGAFVLLPELGDTGFSFDLDAIVDDCSLEWAGRVARRFGVWLQAGYAVREPGGVKGLNRATIIAPDGEPIGHYDKIHPFSFGRESEHYQGGTRIVLRHGGTKAGSPVVCPFICYDLRFPEIWRAAALAGAELFTIGASWPDARQHHWRKQLIARAIENQGFVVGVNRIGSDPHLSYAGGSIIVSPMGDVLAEAGGGPAVLQAELDLDELRAWRAKFPTLRDAHEIQIDSIEIDSTI